MPKKSRRFKELQSKRKKDRQLSSVPVTPPLAVTRTDKPVAATPSAHTPAPKRAPGAVRYPYVVAELRRIGILAGIVLAILVVLALTLP